MGRPSRTRLKRPIFWLKFFLKILHFLRLINHSLLRQGPHAEVHLRTREVKRVLAKLDIKKFSGPDSIPVCVLKYVLRHWPHRIAICSTFRSNRVNFLHVGKLQTFSPFPKKRLPLGPRQF